jgi:hypothetical protein
MLLRYCSCQHYVWGLHCSRMLLVHAHFVDWATRYNLVFRLKDLSSNSILSAFHLFCGDVGSCAQCFRSDCNTKLFGTKIRKHLVINNDLNIIAVTAGCQSANGLVKSHWKVMVHMSRAYLTEKQTPLSFLFYLAVYSKCMMNTIPGKFWGRLASSFQLVHQIGHDKCTCFPLFSLFYFNHDKDGSTQCTHDQSHTMDGFATGCPPTLNALLVYNPRTKAYHEPNLYRFDPYWLPSLAYPQLQYNGGLFSATCYETRILSWKISICEK